MGNLIEALLPFFIFFVIIPLLWRFFSGMMSGQQRGSQPADLRQRENKDLDRLDTSLRDMIETTASRESQREVLEPAASLESLEPLERVPSRRPAASGASGISVGRRGLDAPLEDASLESEPATTPRVQAPGPSRRTLQLQKKRVSGARQAVLPLLRSQSSIRHVILANAVLGPPKALQPEDQERSGL